MFVAVCLQRVHFSFEYWCLPSSGRGRDAWTIACQCCSSALTAQGGHGVSWSCATEGLSVTVRPEIYSKRHRCLSAKHHFGVVQKCDYVDVASTG